MSQALKNQRHYYDDNFAKLFFQAPAFELNRQHYFWRPRHNGEDIDVDYLKSIVENGMRYYNKTALCATEQKPKSPGLGENVDISRMVYCEDKFSVRLINNVAGDPITNNIRIFCRQALDIAFDTIRGCEVDQDDLRRYPHKYRPKFTVYWTEGQTRFDRPGPPSENYEYLGRSFWQDTLVRDGDIWWWVQIGYERHGCPEPKDEAHGYAILTDSSWAFKG